MRIVKQYCAKAKPIIGAAVDTLFPARCAVCRESVGAHGSLCPTCWQNIHFISDPMCGKCGLPFEYHIGEQAVCGRCMAHNPAYAQARAVFRYNDASRTQVLALKYYDQTQLAPVFGSWLARIAQEYTGKTQAIIPVPLHYTRLLTRRYNQAALLAHAVAKHTNLPVLPDTLVRSRKTPSQSGLTRKQRENNMRGAFYISPSKAFVIKEKSVLLVDDVMTTGATLEACSRTLHDAGVRDVYVLTLARTVLVE